MAFLYKVSCSSFCLQWEDHTLAKPEDTPYHCITVEYHLPSSLVGLMLPCILSKPYFCPPHRQISTFYLSAGPSTLHSCNVYPTALIHQCTWVPLFNSQPLKSGAHGLSLWHSQCHA